MFRCETAILGGGASGLMLASLLGPRHDYRILEGNATIGAKIAVSGGGRCNLTNRRLDPRRYRGDERFISRIFARYDNRWLLDWFGRQGLEPVLRKRWQYFCPHSAQEVIGIFRRRISPSKLLVSTRIEGVEPADGGFRIRTDRGTGTARRVVVATGGMSYPRLGASGIGLKIAEALGHPVVPTAPALVGLTLQKGEFFFKSLSGIAVPVRITLAERAIESDLLFAHRGISGPAVLDASLWWERGEIAVDFLPGFALESLTRSPRQLTSLLPLPRRAAKAFLDALGVRDMAGRRCDAATLKRLERLKDYRFAPAGTMGYFRAEAMRGGVATDGIDPDTMQSRKCPGLYFVGEVLDVTGEVGGYNFQWAFSSAAVCAEAIGN